MKKGYEPGYGKRLADARYGAGLTQAELAHKAGVSILCISNAENEYRKPNRESLSRLCTALGTAEAWLRDGRNGPAPLAPLADLSAVDSKRLADELASRGFQISWPGQWARR